MAKDPPARARFQSWRAALAVAGAMLILSAIPAAAASSAAGARAPLPPQLQRAPQPGGVKETALSHGALNEAVQGLDRVLHNRKGPMTQARRSPPPSEDAGGRDARGSPFLPDAPSPP